ncbi:MULTISPECIES: SDR family oxidoreductase [unclassified Pseudomonas]|jgi:NADP-dependent 3-hydroxy acid dehydrogenase YdfG|uniref:SDR family oxidoreductase n=1 Tax=unclassified Pseudomonas TaxID=196821 RepID=UPI000357A926|nr:MULTISPECIES: SDR family oxidoreductase [unclassified Pseudomonas]MBK3430853.1 SDR family oxidoreductase [Pseudomonas fluorescens]EPJ75672.1 putative short-chain dehydrogenase/oxidoreductase [Pseudomonas sp. CFT9]MBK3484320.1 SDR family oxidoreductase [Pseudomonas fluorescens]MCF5511701.1 SDR family NAD(P)-dependent oxidoreductase [Pseudomonas sp. PA-3-6H]MCF5516396.1 SDR family NAD(P)-dependent oxidoreductase [Pseudomonas sp. PA-3-6E]
MNYLQNKVVIVTGASSGIGAATTRALVAQGARVVAAALDGEALESFVADLREAASEVVAFTTDVTQPDQTQALARFARETYGAIDILVNNAGLMLFSRWVDLAVQDWEKMIDVNIKGYLNMTAAVLPFMLEQKSGQILNMDSVAGHQVGPSAGVYSATKFFVQAMTESMRKELGVQHGIRVNTISPGVINTGWADKVSDPQGRKAAQALNRIAIGPDDVARAVIYALNQPENVTVNDLIISPTRQDW